MAKLRLALIGALLLAACEADPVVWQDATPKGAEGPTPASFAPQEAFGTTVLDTGAAIAIATTGDLEREARAQSLLGAALRTMPELPADSSARAKPAMSHNMQSMSTAVGTDLGTHDSPADSARCARSLRSLSVPGVGRVAVWWSLRRNDRVVLVAAWRFGAEGDSTTSWRGPIIVDTLDRGPEDANANERGATGCKRPAPGLAVDANHYVHVSYALNAAEGPGIFYAHQMDPRSGFEPPQVIVYGDYLGQTRVAAYGDRVAVVYEDPNSQARTQIGLALSNTSGHGFVDRITVSSSSSIARDPHVLMVGRALVVGWSDLPSSNTELPAFKLRRAVIR